MKAKIYTELTAISMAILLLTVAGCLSTDQAEKLRDSAHTAILEYVENQGTAELTEYIDQLVAEGRLGAANAEKIKEAIPLGIEKLREIMGELEEEEVENE